MRNSRRSSTPTACAGLCREVLSSIATRGAALAGDNLARAKALAVAKDRLRSKWGGIRIVGIHTSGNGHYRVATTCRSKRWSS